MSWAKVFLAISAAVLPVTNIVFGQSNKGDQIERPKLVIGIVVDQMRYDYLYKYWAFPVGWID